MIRFFVSIFMVVIFMVPAFADSVSLQHNCDDSNSICNLMVDLMRSDSSYDAFNQYVVMRTGDYEYRLYFGKDLDKASVKYVYHTAYMGNPASLQRGSSGPLTIQDNGYIYTGNVDGAAASASADQYKTNYVIVVVAVALLLLVLFKLFRRQKSNGTRSYRVR